jgi:hypothetical protein
VTRKYPYYPAWDGKKPSPLILKCAELSMRRWKGTKNLGTYVNRDMRGKPGQKSVHATGFALDLGYKDEAQAREIWDFFVNNSLALNVAEVHWYTFGKFGAGYRCSRGEGKPGVKIYENAAESAGTGGKWLHIELVDMDVAEWEQRFRALKPKEPAGG